MNLYMDRKEQTPHASVWYSSPMLKLRISESAPAEVCLQSSLTQWQPIRAAINLASSCCMVQGLMNLRNSLDDLNSRLVHVCEAHYSVVPLQHTVMKYTCYRMYTVSRHLRWCCHCFASLSWVFILPILD